MKLNDDDRKAAKCLAETWMRLPNLATGIAKDIVKDALGISRIGEERWGAIRDLAEALHLRGQRTDKDLAQQAVGVYALLDNRQEQPQEPPQEQPRKERKEASAGPTGYAHLGALLSGQLREESKGLGPDQNAAVLFCHCPHCGEAIRIGASVNKENER